MKTTDTQILVGEEAKSLMLQVMGPVFNPNGNYRVEVGDGAFNVIDENAERRTFHRMTIDSADYETNSVTVVTVNPNFSSGGIQNIETSEVFVPTFQAVIDEHGKLTYERRPAPLNPSGKYEQPLPGNRHERRAAAKRSKSK